MSFAFIAAPPPPTQIHTKESHTPTVTCDGQMIPSALGHPKVTLRFDESRTAVCPYCSQLFHLAADTPVGH